MSDPTQNDLTEDERDAIDSLWARRLTSTHYQLLGVPRTADRKAIRDAYFALSRRFHPDVFFNRNLGEYRTRIDEVFRMLTRAYDVLSNAKQRAGYDLHLESLESTPPPPPTERPPASTSTPPVSIPSAPPVPTFPPPAARPTVPMAAMGGAVVPPPPPRTLSTATASPMAQTASQPIDPAVRQRALESMRRRLNSVVPGGAKAAPTPQPMHPPAPPPPRVDDREARLSRILGDGEEAQKRGDFEKALEHFRNALQIAKDDDSIQNRVNAVDQLLKAQKTGAYIEKARDAMREGKAEIAASMWEKAWEGRPTDAALLVNAAEVLAKYGNNRGKAKELAQRALAVDPKAVKAHIVLAQVFIAAGLKASARGAIESIARLDPENPILKELREKLGPPSLAEQLGLRGR
ncbi:MAG: DnaJ domain-containing protein [Polyangiales bacterium]